MPVTMLDFLLQPAGFDIGETGMVLFDATQPLWRALLVGLSNTLRVSLPALVVATMLGGLIALARRAQTPAIRTAALVYTDAIRNVPLLVQLLLWYFLLVEWLPDSTAALHVIPGVLLSKGGLAFPWWDTLTGQWSWPAQDTFNVSGGASVTPEYLAVAVALTLYTSAFLSEVIRGGLEAVSPSLAEAAQTLGATRWQITIKVVIPQAFRTIIPAATNQYLNLIKNSSLAVAVGYPDLVSVSNTAANQTGQALQCVVVMMTVYLALSLLTSTLMNVFNARHTVKGAP